jgi:hypothetical protein
MTIVSLADVILNRAGQGSVQNRATQVEMAGASGDKHKVHKGHQVEAGDADEKNNRCL